MGRVRVTVKTHPRPVVSECGELQARLGLVSRRHHLVRLRIKIGIGFFVRPSPWPGKGSRLKTLLHPQLLRRRESAGSVSQTIQKPNITFDIGMASVETFSSFPFYISFQGLII